MRTIIFTRVYHVDDDAIHKRIQERSLIQENEVEITSSLKNEVAMAIASQTFRDEYKNLNASPDYFFCQLQQPLQTEPLDENR